MKALLLRMRPRREHIVRLVGALVLALVVWVYVTISRNPETQFPFKDVTVQVRGLMTGFVLTNTQGIPLQSLEKVSLTVWAPQAEHLGLADMRVYVDLSAIKEAGTYELPVLVETERAVRTWTVVPDHITVRVEPLRQELFSIKVVLLGQPGLPYIVGTARVDPSQTVVQGPLSRLDLVNRVEARVDLAGSVAPLENAPVAVLAVDEAGNPVEGVTVVPAQVTLNVPISLKGGHIAVSVVPVTAGRLAAGYYLQEITVSPNTVTIFSGDPAMLASVRYLETTPVELTARRQDFTVTASLDLPPNVSLINSPSQVTVTVHLGTIMPQFRLTIPIRVDGSGEGLTATWEPQWLGVSVQGTLESLQGLSLDNLWAVADASGLDAGEYDLPLTFPVLPGVEITPLYTNTVHVLLVEPATPTPNPTPLPPQTPAPAPTSMPTPLPTPIPTPSPPPTVAPTPTISPTVPIVPTPTGTPGPSPTLTAGPSPTPTRLPSPTP